MRRYYEENEIGKTFPRVRKRFEAAIGQVAIHSARCLPGSPCGVESRVLRLVARSARSSPALPPKLAICLATRKAAVLPRTFLPGEFVPSQALPDRLSDGDAEALRIGHHRAAIMLAIVVAKRLFIDVAEQVEGFDAHVGAIQTALEETPEVLHTVGVDISTDILFGVVDDLVYILFFQSPIGHQFVGEDVGTLLYVGVYMTVWRVSLSRLSITAVFTFPPR